MVTASRFVIHEYQNLYSSLTNSVNQQGGRAVAKSPQRFSGYEMTQHKNAFV
jgi:hypothetical protein